MSRRRRDTSDEERALFEAALKDAAPLKKNKARSYAKPKPGAAKAKLKASTVPPPPPPGSFPALLANTPPPTGINGHTAARLERGALEPDARIDLHGMTEAVAHHALAAFIRGAALRGHRLVLVVTGKGLKPADPYEPFDLELVRRRRGLLRTMTPRWLREPELAHLVADMRPAHRKHGGEGALYVYLRKSR